MIVAHELPTARVLRDLVRPGAWDRGRCAASPEFSPGPLRGRIVRDRKIARTLQLVADQAIVFARLDIGHASRKQAQETYDRALRQMQSRRFQWLYETRRGADGHAVTLPRRDSPSRLRRTKGERRGGALPHPLAQ